MSWRSKPNESAMGNRTHRTDKTNERVARRVLCRCLKHFRRPGGRDCRQCHAASNQRHRQKMVSVPRDLLPVELWTARGRKALKRLGKRVVVKLEEATP
jgi:hypothetical protein